eukprot:3136396-Rhodomonas_salina.2
MQRTSQSMMSSSRGAKLPEPNPELLASEDAERPLQCRLVLTEDTPGPENTDEEVNDWDASQEHGNNAPT